MGVHKIREKDIEIESTTTQKVVGMCCHDNREAFRLHISTEVQHVSHNCKEGK